MYILKILIKGLIKWLIMLFIMEIFKYLQM